MLYTFFLDYRGGTYLAQVNAESPAAAVLAWADQLDPAVVDGFPASWKDEFLAKISGEVPVAITGLVQTWCSSFLIADEGALVHFVRTHED